MEMVACIILTDIQAMAPYMMIIMVTAFGVAVAVAAARGRRAQVLVRRVVVPVAMVGVLALGHAQVVAVTDNLAMAAFFKV